MSQDLPSFLLQLWPEFLPLFLVTALAVTSFRYDRLVSLLLFGAVAAKAGLLAFDFWGVPELMRSRNHDELLLILRLRSLAGIAPWLLLLAAVFCRREARAARLRG